MPAQIKLDFVQFLYCMSLFTILKKHLTNNILLINNLKN